MNSVSNFSIENIPVACGYFNAQGELVEANKKWSVQLPCGTLPMDSFRVHIREALEKGDCRFELALEHPNQDTSYWEITMQRETSNMVAVCAQDISSHKKAVLDSRSIRELDAKFREAEREANNMMKMLLENSPALIEIWDSNFRLVECNQRILDLFGIPSQEEYLARYDEFMPEFQPCGTSSIEKGIAHTAKTLEVGSHRYEWERRLPNGEPLPVDVIQFRVEREGKILIIAYNHDLRLIKSAMKMEAEREMVNRIQLMFDATPLVIEYWDRDFNSIDCNQTAIDYYEFSSKDEYKKKLFYHSPDVQPNGIPSRFHWNNELDKIFEDGIGVFEFTENINGRTVFQEVQGIRMKYNNDIVVVTYSKDITQLAEIQEERQRVKVAEESSIAKSKFLARMSHEIRTPISAVLGISEIELQNPALDPRTGESFAKIHNSGEMLLHIVNDILDLSKIEAGKMELLPEEYEVGGIVNDAAHIRHGYLNGKDIKFSISVDENLPAKLIGDVPRIGQVINNLLSNAFKYTNSGSVKLSLRGEPHLVNQDYILLIISIADTGYGMTLEQIDSIYRDYTRFHENEDRISGGTGLGMPIVYSLLEMMDGKIEMNSQVGRGTVVTVSIPQLIASYDTLGSEAASELQKLESITSVTSKQFSFAPERMPYGKVLVVDDVDANLFVARGLLSFYDLMVETCESGYDAIAKVKAGSTYDIIFMDHMMPGLNGVETMRILRDLDYSLPIVVLTANAMIGQEEEFMKNGFDGFISKPIQTKNLNNFLVRYVRDKYPPEVVEAAKAGSSSPVVQNGIDSFLDREDITDKLRADFAKSHKDVFKKIAQAIDDDDIETAHRVAHSLKGLAGLIKETKLLSAAGELEKTLAKGKKPSSLKDLETELANVLEGIGEPELTQFYTASLDKEKAAELFDQLIPLLESRNASCLNYLKELSSIPETGLIIKQLEDFDFALALANLHTLRGMLDC